MIQAPTDSPRIAVDVPTYNHGRAVRGVLESIATVAREHGLVIIVVNDGSTDDTAQALEDWENTDDRLVVTHPTNRGKAVALQSGFDKALSLGHTHALTIDSDGQHDASDIPALLQACNSNPNALILGERSWNIEGCPRASRVGRRLSNLMVRIESGLTVSDSQCGLRVYPLALTHRLGGHYGRYGFETSILTRFAWARLPIVCVPVRCVYNVPGGRVSHFRAYRDSITGGAMHLGLFHRALLPGRRIAVPVDVHRPATGTMFDRFVRWMSPVALMRAIRMDYAQRRRVALSFGTGVFIGVLPIYGVKTCVCLAVARWLRLEPLAMLASSSVISAPPAGPILAIASITTGSLIIRGELPELSRYDPRVQSMLEILGYVAAEWTVGGLVLGVMAGSVTYLISKWLLVRGRRDVA